MSPQNVTKSLPKPKFTMTCSMCTFAVNLLVSYVRSNRTEAEVAQSAISICVTFNIESKMVCEGVINSIVGDIVYIIKHSTLKEGDVCGFVMASECEDSNFENAFGWNISFPVPEKPTVKPLIPPKDNLPTLRILHLSDTHLDPYYQEGSNAVCGAPLCCRQSLGMPSDPVLQAGKWGDYRDCDSPNRTLQHMLQHISENHKLDMVFWTGDLPPHDVHNQTKRGNVNIIKQVTEMLKVYFPNTPIFPALGNHESEPINCFPPPEIEGKYNISWLYDELSKTWTDLLQKDVKATVEKGAYYSVPVSEGFRIISINMNYCHNKNWWLLINSTDPANELAWLINELTKAELFGEKVYLLGHIPPGHVDCTKVWSRNFHQVIQRFENTVVAQFYGHTHFDEMMVFYDDDYTRAINVAYIGSSTTPYSLMNPSYKIYTADGNHNETTRMILDGETYYMNLTEANLNDNPQWTLLYSYKDSYKMPSLLPSEWNTFFHKMLTDRDSADKFLTHLHRASSAFPDCDDECYKELVCRQIVAKSTDLTLCDKWGTKPSDGTFNRLGVYSTK